MYAFADFYLMQMVISKWL